MPARCPKCTSPYWDKPRREGKATTTLTTPLYRRGDLVRVTALGAATGWREGARGLVETSFAPEGGEWLYAVRWPWQEDPRGYFRAGEIEAVPS